MNTNIVNFSGYSNLLSKTKTAEHQRQALNNQPEGEQNHYSLLSNKGLGRQVTFGMPVVPAEDIAKKQAIRLENKEVVKLGKALVTYNIDKDEA